MPWRRIAARRGRGAGQRELGRAATWPSTSISVIAGVSDTRSSPPGKATIPLRASSSRSDQPAASSASAGGGEGQGHGLRAGAAAAARR